MRLVLRLWVFLFSVVLCNAIQAENYTLDQFDEAIAALPVADPTKRSPLQMNATLVPANAQPGETVVAVVKIRLMPGWHFYSRVPANEPFIQTQWFLELGEGLRAVDDWSGPEPQPYNTNPEMRVFKGGDKALVFFRELVVTDKATDSVGVSAGLRFQVCDPYICLPPKKSMQNLKLMVKAP